MDGRSAMQHATPASAARRGVSDIWALDFPAITGGSGGSGSSSTNTPAVTTTTLSTQVRPAPLISDGPEAVRATINKLALNAKLGPHRGPGSGALLTAHISQMHSALERLNLWQDRDSESDTDKADSDED